MRRAGIVMAILALIAVGATAIEVEMDAGLGATYEWGDNLAADTGNVLADGIGTLLNALTALRAGGFLDATIPIAGPISAGAEIGLFFFASSDDDGESQFTPLLDIPGRGFVRASFGEFHLQGHVGYNFATFIDLTATNSIGIAHKFELGARLTVGLFYLQVDRLAWGADSRSTRLGVGLALYSLFGEQSDQNEN